MSSNKGTIYFNDTVKFSLLDQNLTKINDDFNNGNLFQPQHRGEPGKYGLNVKIAATHSGTVIRNNRLYLPDRMRRGARTFVENYPAPVLLHHDDKKDPIGRVIESNYIDTSESVISDRWTGNNQQMIKDFVGDTMPFGQKVDIVCNLLKDSLNDSSYEGLGYVQITANITEPEAVQKLLDGRYLTGSVGASTNQAVCSICKLDWADSGPCEHKPGSVYDEANCFLIAGDLSYDEYSFVNVPADRHSRVLQLDYNGSTQEIEVADEYNGRIHEVQLGFPQFDSVSKEDTDMAQGKVNDSTNDNRENSVKDQNNTDASKTNDEKTVDTTTSDSAKSDLEDTNESNTSTDTENTASDVEDNAESNEDFLKRIFDLEEKGESLSVEDKNHAYEVLWEEAVAAKEEGKLPLDDELFKDAKLSDDQRNKLPKSAFCGPDRSFPVPDCAHVTAVQRLVDRYDSLGSSKEIVDSVSRKAKAMGCSEKANDSTTSSTEVEDNHATRVMRSILNLLEDDTMYNSGESVLEEEEMSMLRSTLKRLASLAGKDSFMKAAVEESLVSDDKAMLDEVEKLETELGEVRDRLQAVQKEYNLVYQDMDALQDALVEEKSKTRKARESQLTILSNLNDMKVEDKDWSKLDDSAIESEVSRLTEEVDMNRITDKLGDGMSRNPEGTVQPPETGIEDNKTEVKITDAVISKIEENYHTLLFKNGVEAAEQYKLRMKQLGFLPTGDKV